MTGMDLGQFTIKRDGHEIVVHHLGSTDTRTTMDTSTGERQSQYVIPFEVSEGGKWRSLPLVFRAALAAEAQERGVQLLHDREFLKPL